MENSIIHRFITEKVWFKQWFDSSFYHHLYAGRNENEAAAFIDELLNEIQPQPSSSMLDLGCGTGRHSKYLSTKGFDVTGLDIAGSSIQKAKRSETASLRFYQHDMRDSFGHQLFDYVFSFFTSFGYFHHTADDHAVINNISESLKPGGVVVMDYMNAAWVEKNLVPKETKEIDGVIYHITRYADKKRIYKRILVEQLTGYPLVYREQVRKFEVSDFEELFSRNGLQLTNVFGDYTLGEYNKETSPRMIVMGVKQ